MGTDDRQDIQVALHRTTKLLKMPETCHQLQLSRAKVDQLIAAGQLKAVKVGRSKRVRAADLDTFIEGLGNATD